MKNPLTQTITASRPRARRVNRWADRIEKAGRYRAHPALHTRSLCRESLSRRPRQGPIRDTPAPISYLTRPRFPTPCLYCARRSPRHRRRPFRDGSLPIARQTPSRWPADNGGTTRAVPRSTAISRRRGLPRARTTSCEFRACAKARGRQVRTWHACLASARKPVCANDTIRCGAALRIDNQQMVGDLVAGIEVTLPPAHRRGWRGVYFLIENPIAQCPRRIDFPSAGGETDFQTASAGLLSGNGGAVKGTVRYLRFL